MLDALASYSRLAISGKAVLLLALAEAVSGNVDPEKYYLGNTVKGRHVEPIPGCTVLGKFYAPLSPLPGKPPFGQAISWDWCQHSCLSNMVTEVDGTSVPCSHFAFYPSGNCYHQTSNVTLVDDEWCPGAPNCMNFQVVSGPPSCDARSLWVDPFYGRTTQPPTTSVLPTTTYDGIFGGSADTIAAPYQETTAAPTLAPTPVPSEAPTPAPTEAPAGMTLPPISPPMTTIEKAPTAATAAAAGAAAAAAAAGTAAAVGATAAATDAAESPGPQYVDEGEECNYSLGPRYALLCKAGFICYVETPMPGKPGVCKSTSAPAVLAGDEASNTEVLAIGKGESEAGLQAASGAAAAATDPNVGAIVGGTVGGVVGAGVIAGAAAGGAQAAKNNAAAASTALAGDEASTTEASAADGANSTVVTDGANSTEAAASMEAATAGLGAAATAAQQAADPKEAPGLDGLPITKTVMSSGPGGIGSGIWIALFVVGAFVAAGGMYTYISFRGDDESGSEESELEEEEEEESETSAFGKP